MKNPEARHSLRDYARSEYSEENLAFYDDVQAFRKRFITFGDVQLSEAEHDEMRAEAERIINKYLKQEADEALNLPSWELERFKAGLPPDQPVATNMFDPTLRIIYKAIEHDTFGRFSRSRKASDALELYPELAKINNNSSAQTSESDADLPTANTLSAMQA